MDFIPFNKSLKLVFYTMFQIMLCEILYKVVCLRKEFSLQNSQAQLGITKGYCKNIILQQPLNFVSIDYT
jgi:hypothetical protein